MTQSALVRADSRRLKERLPRRSDYGRDIFCAVCGEPIGLQQRVRELDALPLPAHLGCFRTVIRKQERIRAMRSVLLAALCEVH